MTFDPRTLGTPVYENLSVLKETHKADTARLKEQKSQAVELYTYLSTWGMMRLKAEEKALKDGKKEMVTCYFTCLEKLTDQKDLLVDDIGLTTLKEMSAEDYLGLTGLGLALAQEFSFWTTVIYHDVKGE
jgi:hypothetical protein